MKKSILIILTVLFTGCVTIPKQEWIKPIANKIPQGEIILFEDFENENEFITSESWCTQGEKSAEISINVTQTVPLVNAQRLISSQYFIFDAQNSSRNNIKVQLVIYNKNGEKTESNKITLGWGENTNICFNLLRDFENLWEIIEECNYAELLFETKYKAQVLIDNARIVQDF